MSPPLACAIAALSKREREALLLVAWEDLDPSRAAQVVGCSAAAFRVRLHRARRHVAAALDCGSASESLPSMANKTS
jgi:RNA polymerase sigma-70 factor, ECF subfamily